MSEVLSKQSSNSCSSQILSRVRDASTPAPAQADRAPTQVHAKRGYTKYLPRVASSCHVEGGGARITRQSPLRGNTWLRRCVLITTMLNIVHSSGVFTEKEEVERYIEAFQSTETPPHEFVQEKSRTWNLSNDEGFYKLESVDQQQCDDTLREGEIFSHLKSAVFELHDDPPKILPNQIYDTEQIIVHQTLKIGKDGTHIVDHNHLKSQHSIRCDGKCVMFTLCNNLDWVVSFPYRFKSDNTGVISVCITKQIFPQDYKVENLCHYRNQFSFLLRDKEGDLDRTGRKIDNSKGRIRWGHQKSTLGQKLLEMLNTKQWYEEEIYKHSRQTGNGEYTLRKYTMTKPTSGKAPVDFSMCFMLLCKERDPSVSKYVFCKFSKESKSWILGFFLAGRNGTIRNPAIVTMDMKPIELPDDMHPLYNTEIWNSRHQSKRSVNGRWWKYTLDGEGSYTYFWSKTRDGPWIRANTL